MLDKEEQYDSIYWPFSLLDDKERVYFKLLDIDCNFSKLLQEILKSLEACVDKVLKKKKNYRDFDWTILVKEKHYGKSARRKVKKNNR